MEELKGREDSLLGVNSRKSWVWVREIPGTVLKPSRGSVCVLARDRHDPVVLLTHS